MSKKWKPSLYGKYWSIQLAGGVDVSEDICYGDYAGIEDFKIGNCFKAKAEAQSKLRAIKKILRGD